MAMGAGAGGASVRFWRMRGRKARRLEVGGVVVGLREVSLRRKLVGAGGGCVSGSDDLRCGAAAERR